MKSSNVELKLKNLQKINTSKPPEIPIPVSKMHSQCKYVIRCTQINFLLRRKREKTESSMKWWRWRRSQYALQKAKEVFRSRVIYPGHGVFVLWGSARQRCRSKDRQCIENRRATSKLLLLTFWLTCHNVVVHLQVPSGFNFIRVFICMSLYQPHCFCFILITQLFHTTNMLMTPWNHQRNRVV